MSSNTTGVLDLPLYDMVNDNGVKFLLFRDALCGSGSNSAMYKINDWATNKVGRNTDLATAEKGTIVGAINEVRSGIGSLADHVTTEVGILGNLTTTNKDNVVAAINEIKGDIGNIDVSWGGISGKPSTFPPADHNHNSVYSPINHNHNGVYSPANHTHTIAQVSGLQEEINSLKSSVSNGKTSVANAITDRGIPANGNDTFDMLATKIGQFPIAKFPNMYNGSHYNLSIPSSTNLTSQWVANEEIYIAGAFMYIERVWSPCAIQVRCNSDTAMLYCGDRWVNIDTNKNTHNVTLTGTTGIVIYNPCKTRVYITPLFSGEITYRYIVD